MAIPKLNELHRPILEALNAAKQGLTSKQIREQISKRLSLTDAELEERIPTGTQTKMVTRTYWAIHNLKNAGFISSPKRGHFEITHIGKKGLADFESTITTNKLEKFTEATETPDIATEDDSDFEGMTPDEKMAQNYEEQQSALASEVLDTVKRISPSNFEWLVVSLLEKMGYGEGEVTGQSSDGGIDGIISQDALGLERICVQAKLRTDGQIGEPDIRNFSGSLDAKGASKGVFITTSQFSTSAHQTAKTISAGSKFIRLIDGRELSELMIKYDLGVFTETIYAVKKLDANYFGEID